MKTTPERSVEDTPWRINLENSLQGKDKYSYVKVDAVDLEFALGELNKLTQTLQDERKKREEMVEVAYQDGLSHAECFNAMDNNIEKLNNPK